MRRPSDLVELRVPLPETVVAAALADETLLTGWLAPTAAEARAMLCRVSIRLESVPDGTEVRVEIPAEADELAGRRRMHDWEDRLLRLSALVRGRPTDWSLSSP